MTRPPPGASFAQFFPNAPKVKAEAQDRADRERTRRKGEGADDSAPAFGHDDSQSLSGRPLNGAGATSHQPGDDSPVGEVSSAVGSASSHESSSSSLFSSATRLVASSNSNLQPDAGSASRLIATSSTGRPQNAQTPPSTRLTYHDAAHNKTYTPHKLSSTDNFTIPERVPARDPSSSVKGLKCTYDPLLDRLRNKGVSKGAKPIYKEFGLVCIRIIYSRMRGAVVL
jgi:histone-lysine N-methyltransferase SETD1